MGAWQRPGADLVPVCPHDNSCLSEGHTRGFPCSNNGKEPAGYPGGVASSGTELNPVHENIRGLRRECYIFKDRIRLCAGGLGGNCTRTRSVISVPYLKRRAQASAENSPV